MKRRLGILSMAACLIFAAGCSLSDPQRSGTALPEEQPSGTVSTIVQPQEGVDGATNGMSPAQPEELPAAGTEQGAAEETKDNKAATEQTKDKQSISVASPQSETINPDFPDDLYMNEIDRELMQSAAEKARQEFNRRNYDVTGTYNPDQPTLMGISLGTKENVVKQHFGEPLYKLSIPEDPDGIAVHSYPGFSIGIEDGTVLFVEVSTRSVNPGLNGLRLGDTREDALEQLGKPTTETDFVLNFVAAGSVLKMDIDPESGKIHSIKLFPEE